MGIPNNGYPALINYGPGTNLNSTSVDVMMLFLPNTTTAYTLAPWEQVTIVSLNMIADVTPVSVLITSIPASTTSTAPVASTLLLVLNNLAGYHDDGAWSISTPTGQPPTVILAPGSADPNHIYITGTVLITSTTGSTVRPLWEALLTNTSSGKF